jgi:hypothetical protein
MLEKIIGGVVIGYLTVSLCESFFHRTIQHASPGFRKMCRRLSTPGSWFHSAWLSHHVVHHCLTYKVGHFTQFTNAEEERNLRQMLIKKGRGNFVKRDYGVRIGGPSDIVLYMAPTMPVFIAVCYFGGLWFTLGAILPLVFWPLVAQFIHPYLHMTRTQAMSCAPLAIRLFLRTPYYRYLFCHHWLHHKYEDCNFNLVLGGDVFLGCQQWPTDEELSLISEYEH